MIDLTNLGTSIFATGIGATLITQFKGSIKSFLQFFRIGYSIVANNETNIQAYEALKEYILKYQGHFHKSTSYEYYYNSKKKQIGYGRFLIRSKWNQLIIIHHEKVKREHGPIYQILTVQIYGVDSKKTYDDIISIINNTIHTNNTVVYSSDRFSSTCIHYVVPRDFSTIFHPQKQKIIDFLENFKNNEDIYKKNGLCYKTGILLYGPPGTGKTSMIKAIATYMNYNILIPSEDFTLTFNSEQANLIICIEDIDRFLNEFSSDKKEREKHESKLHKMLQMFDGLISPSNIIFIATTNHIEVLPEELIRDGRFDCKICLNNIDKDYAKQMCANFGVEISDILSKDQKYPINPAFLQNKILQNLNSIREIK